MPGEAGFAAAVAAWRAALGAARVECSAAALEAANKATLASATSVTAVLSPGDAGEVAVCLGIATRFRVPVHPISRGNNWGYGSRLPARGASALLSLARMDRVLGVDEALATVRVEPGVSFAALATSLRQAAPGLLPPSTGSGPHTSVLGNVMERGIGKGLYEDMAAHAAGFEVVLPCGSIVRTGAFAGPARAAGPDPAGLFVQSNLGVVTAMEFRLHRAPAFRQLGWLRLEDGAALAGFVDALRPLLQRGDPRVRPEVVSGHRAATQGASVGLVGGWLAAVWMWADDAAELAGRRGAVQAALGLPGLGPLELGAPEPGNQVEIGNEGLRGAYAAMQGGMPDQPDPDRDGCGVIWVAPALPMRGEVVAEAVRAIGGLMVRHGFGPAISLRGFDGRAVKAVAGLFHDRAEPGGDARAAAAAAAVHGWMRENGVAAYRLGILDNDPMADPGRRILLDAIRRTTDPAGILAPGRYDA